MPKITVEMSSQLSPDQTFEKLKTLFETDTDLKKLDSSYICQFNSASRSGTAKGNKFSAAMSIADKGNSSQLSLNVDIPFLFSPFKGMIQEILQKKLKKVLG